MIGRGITRSRKRFLYIPRDQTINRQPYLKRGEARILAERVEEYETQTGSKPAPVVLHKTSRFPTEEEEGFREALLSEVPAYELLWIGPTGFHLDNRSEAPCVSQVTIISYLPASRQRECILRAVVSTAGREPFSRIDKAAIERGVERRAANPHAQRHFLQTMRGMFQWAVKAKHIDSDPTRDLKTIRPATDRHTPWPQEWCDAFEARWPHGTRERLAYDVLLYTGFPRRRNDKIERADNRWPNIIVTGERGDRRRPI
jgi:hypothetical protein